jgi:hypothetical protein
MNPDVPTPPSPEPVAPTPPPVASPPSELSQMMAKLGAAERLVLLGAAVIVAGYLLFNVIIAEYAFSHVGLLMGIWAIGAAWFYHQRSGGNWAVPYPVVLKVVGYTAGVFGVLELLVDLRYGVLDRAADLLGALMYYAGAGLMLWGARSLPKA